MNKEYLRDNPLLLGRLKLFGLTKMHEQGYNGKGIKIGIIDVFEEMEHGTNTDSQISGENVYSQMHGLAPGATIIKYNLPKRFYATDVERALKECIVDQVDIVNMSLGTKEDAWYLYKIVKECYEKEILMVCAAGNDGNKHADYVDIKEYPEEYKETVSVGSVDSNLHWSSFESHGKSIDLVGIGRNAVIKMKDGSYQLGSGTSDSTPQITGFFACVWSMLRQRGAEPFIKDLKEYVFERCVDLGTEGKDNFYGRGFPTMDIKEWHEMYLELNGITKGILSERVDRIKNGELEEEVNKDYNIMDHQEYLSTDGTIIEIPMFNLNRGLNG